MFRKSVREYEYLALDSDPRETKGKRKREKNERIIANLNLIDPVSEWLDLAREMEGKKA